MIRAFLFTVVLIIGLAFAALNTQQTVVLRFLLGYSTPPLPVYQLAAGGFLIGMGLTVLLVFPEWVKLRWELKRQRKAFLKIEKQMNKIRPPEGEPASPVEETPEPPLSPGRDAETRR